MISEKTTVAGVIALLITSVILAGCNPYMAAVSAASATYGAATDVRPLSTQVSDDEIEAEIEKGLLESPVPGTGSLTVYSRRGVVVLAGVVSPGSGVGSAAVQIARTTPGVKRVETFFVPYQPSSVSDLEIKAKVKEAFVADSQIIAGQVDIGVYGGHVILVGVVDSPEQVEEFVSDAQSVNGVITVRSYIQLAS